ncbi:MAG: Phage integrase family protein [Anaerolineales bacterium]|nr:Phage integrase family protein [Anaerolineales bacterium]
MNPIRMNLSNGHKHGVHLEKRYAPHGVYYVRVSIGGRRFCQSTQTDDVKEARRRAREMILGWQRGIAAPKARSEFARLGKVRAEFEKWSRVPGRFKTQRTPKDYMNTLWLVVRRGLGNEDMTEQRVAELSTSVLTGKLVKDFEAWMLTRTEGEPERIQAARVCVDRYLRQSRSVFGADARQNFREEGVVLPDLTEFLTRSVTAPEDVEPVPPTDAEMRPLFEALPQLAVERPDLHLVFLLAVYTGLRRRTLSRLRWEHLVEREPGEFWLELPSSVLKQKKSQRVPVHPALKIALDARRTRAGESVFMLPGAEDERRYLRSETLFRGFNGWMKSIGWTRKQTLHALRKFYLRKIECQHGRSAAQLLAGHAETSVLARNYIGQPVTPRALIELPGSTMRPEIALVPGRLVVEGGHLSGPSA